MEEVEEPGSASKTYSVGPATAEKLRKLDSMNY